MMPSRVSTPWPSSPSDRPPLDAFLARRDDDPIDEAARRVNALRIEGPDLDQLLDLRDRDFARRGRHRVEVPRGLAIHEVAEPVALPGRDHREVPDDSALEEIV